MLLSCELTSVQCWVETFLGSLLFGPHCFSSKSYRAKVVRISFLDGFHNNLLREASKCSAGFSRGNHKGRALQYNDHETKGTFVDMTVMGWQGIREDLGLEI